MRRESAESRTELSVRSAEEMREAGLSVPSTSIVRERLPALEKLPTGTLDQLMHWPAEAFYELLVASVKREGESVRAGLTTKDVGTVRRIGDGVASVWGLPLAQTEELVEFSTGVLGLVMNLEREWVDCILLGPDEGIQGGDVVSSTGRRITIPVGERLLGRVVDPLGRPLDGDGDIGAREFRFIEREAPGVVKRQTVDEPLQTGIKAIDAIVPIGRGQRELILGDRQTGKTSIALDAIINQREGDVLCVYVSIGQRKASMLRALRILREADAMENTVVVVANPDDPPALLYLAPYSGCTIAEKFLDQGRDVLIVYDDLSKHADAYRELSLLLRRPPGREAYPGDIFYLHARLLERACRLSDAEGGGSITALPIIETQRGNISAYIPTNLISITDGQIYLSTDLFNQNIKPAVDVGQSVSRVGGQAQREIMRQISSEVKLTLAQYEEVERFARFGTEIDTATQRQITHGRRLREVLKQDAYHPLSLPQQVLILYAAGEGYLDDLSVDRVADFERELWRYAQRNYGALIRRIEGTDSFDEELERDIRGLIQEAKGSFV
ncbi:MAG: F0F1 ATP synthase subunit alpha [Chloroflexota bacterium]|nr:F0F1 ATP synthase subunit alpha [Chloroflexota bacterium]